MATIACYKDSGWNQGVQWVELCAGERVCLGLTVEVFAKLLTRHYIGLEDWWTGSNHGITVAVLQYNNTVSGFGQSQGPCFGKGWTCLVSTSTDLTA